MSSRWVRRLTQGQCGLLAVGPARCVILQAYRQDCRDAVTLSHLLPLKSTPSPPSFVLVLFMLLSDKQSIMYRQSSRGCSVLFCSLAPLLDSSTAVGTSVQKQSCMYETHSYMLMNCIYLQHGQKA